MTALTTQQQQQQSMEEHWLWYLAGTFDTAGSFTTKIQKNDSYAVGYDFRPMVTLSRTGQKRIVFGMVDEYAEEHNVYYRIEESQNETEQLIIDDEDSIERFLEPLIDGFVQQRDQAEVMLNEIVPAVQEEEHQTQQGLYELMDSVEKLREILSARRTPKYTKEYFAEEWDMS